MTTLPLYNLLHNYLQHSWNVTSITTAVLTVRDMLPVTSDTKKKKKKRTPMAFYPSDMNVNATDFFATARTDYRTERKNALMKSNATGLLSAVTPRYRAPRAPIVLCHGLYGFDRMGSELLPSMQVHYWNGIEKALCDLGAKVIVTRVPKTETISNRAYALHTILSSFMSNKELNFVGHSMGGLDCRYLISHMKHRAYRVASLTTVCTPHRGSPVMDWFRDTVGVGQHKLSSSPTMDTSSCMMGDISSGLMRRSAVSPTKSTNIGPTTTTTNLGQQQERQRQRQQLTRLLVQYFDTPAYGNLTTDYCTQYFNPSTPDDPSVSYYSYTAKSTPAPWMSSLLDLPGQFIQQVDGDNDGVVSVNSGRYGHHVKTVEDADHWDFTGKSVVPYRWKNNNAFDRNEFYVELANHLYEQGH